MQPSLGLLDRGELPRAPGIAPERPDFPGFRRPVVVGLVYVFFFEALVPSLPGSLKLLSLTFYARSLMYNEATAAGYPSDMLEVSEPVSALTAWCVLIFATVAITVLGMWLFARSEYRDDL